MKKKMLAVALCAGLISTFAMARGGHHSSNHGQNQNSTYLGSVVSSTPIADLTQEQKDDLVFMYQEEKVARDVYKTLGDIWGESVFFNIQNAEQKHMDAIKTLLDKYSIPVPVIEDTTGVFENAELQSLYDQLVEQGKVSLEEALNVGVLVEETDIADLEAKIVDTPDDIEAVFERLLEGSNHHLTAFNRVLNGGYHQSRYHRGGHHQNGYHQDKYHQNEYHQNEYHQNGYHQNGYHQNKYHQDKYHQDKYHQNGYHHSK